MQNDALREPVAGDMASLCQRASQINAPLIIIAHEVGAWHRAHAAQEQRRLRDLNGWFVQDATRPSRSGLYCAGMDWLQLIK